MEAPGEVNHCGTRANCISNFIQLYPHYLFPISSPMRCIWLGVIRSIACQAPVKINFQEQDAGTIFPGIIPITFAVTRIDPYL
ncbi:hypothetical protein SDJN03_06548, partial [Cucurbita argyrosperma subsp. sororia]